MPLATAAEAISSEVLTADIMIGTTVDSSLSDRGMFCSFAAARICPNSSLIAGKYRSVVEIAVIKLCDRCKARMAATIFCMEAFRTRKIPASVPPGCCRRSAGDWAAFPSHIGIQNL